MRKSYGKAGLAEWHNYAKCKIWIYSKKYIEYAAMELKVLRDLVSSNIRKTSDPSPPTPNKIEF